MIRILLILALLFGALVSEAQQRRQQIFHITTGLNSTMVPFELINNMIVVPVVVNGEKELNFILDNGTKNPVIFSREYVRGLNFDYGPTINFRGVGSRRSARGRVVKGVSLHISGVATDLIGMVVLNQGPLGRLSMGGRTIHGVLGSTLFRCFVIEIDYVRQELHLHDRPAFVPDDSYESMPMRVIDNKAFVRASVKKGNKNIHSNFMVDTGFNNKLILLLPDYIDRRAFVGRNWRKVGFGYGGDVFAQVGRMDTLRIGSLVLNNLYTIVPPSKNIPLHRDTPEIIRQGTLGNAAFAHTSVIFDYPGNTFYVKRPAAAGEREEEIL